MSRGPLWRREPLGVLLVAINLTLGGVLLYRFVARPAARLGLPPGHPDVSVPADLAAPNRGDAGADASFALSGLVRLSPTLKAPWPKGAYVFVIARPEGQEMPYAVRRYAGVKPPFAFGLGPKDVMIRSMNAPPALFRVSVRVDQDGNALTRQLGDLEGGPSTPISRGSSIELVVDREATLSAP